MGKEFWESLREAGFVRDVPYSTLSSSETAQFEKILSPFAADSDHESLELEDALYLSSERFNIETPFVLWVQDAEGEFQCVVGEEHEAGSDAATLFHRGAWESTRLEAIRTLVEELTVLDTSCT